MLGWRPHDLDPAYLPFLRGVGTRDYFTDPAFRAALAAPPEEDLAAAVAYLADDVHRHRAELGDLAFAARALGRPDRAQGHPAPRRRAPRVDAGMDGVVVSNHGGRQVDGAVGVARRAAGGRDGRRRPGAGAVRLRRPHRRRRRLALALGADAVLLGRPYVYGLALDGEAGVRHVLRCVLAELDATLALAGYASLAELRAEPLAHIERG